MACPNLYDPGYLDRLLQGAFYWGERFGQSVSANVEEGTGIWVEFGGDSEPHQYQTVQDIIDHLKELQRTFHTRRHSQNYL